MGKFLASSYLKYDVIVNAMIIKFSGQNIPSLQQQKFSYSLIWLVVYHSCINIVVLASNVIPAVTVVLQLGNNHWL